MGNVVSAGLGQVSLAWRWHAAEIAAVSIPEEFLAAGTGTPGCTECGPARVCGVHHGQQGVRQWHEGRHAGGAEHPSRCPAASSCLLCKSYVCGAVHDMLPACAGVNDTVVAGGMESMSNMPYYLKGARLGLRMGHGQLTDGARALPAGHMPHLNCCPNSAAYGACCGSKQDVPVLAQA